MVGRVEKYHIAVGWTSMVDGPWLIAMVDHAVNLHDRQPISIDF
jgi:hypothetical protein